jgi:pimeloyl-ACP methyl ester carboxylesterase
MKQQLINFVHANGFSAPSYQTFFNCFGEQISLIAQQKYGHNPDYPWHNNWQYLVDEVIAFVLQQSQQHKQQVIGVGHSFGGVITYMAACQRPDLFKGIILLDPPVLIEPVASMMRLLKKTRFIDKVTPAIKAVKRRRNWPLDSNMVDQFKHRQLFKNFDPRCLKDYADNAVTKRDQRLELVFSPEVEAGIFRNVAVNLSQYKNQLSVPGALIYAQNSDLYPSYIFRHFAKKHKLDVHCIEQGGHMFPLERPEHSAQLIESVIKHW